MRIDSGFVVTVESMLCSECVLTEGVLEQERVSYVLYVYSEGVRFYREE